MYLADSGTCDIDAFDPATSNLRRRRTIVISPRPERYRTGLTVSHCGNIWVVLWNGGALARQPHVGRLLRIDSPGVTVHGRPPLSKAACEPAPRLDRYLPRRPGERHAPRPEVITFTPMGGCRRDPTRPIVVRAPGTRGQVT